MKSLNKDWLFVAALHSDDFFDSPGLKKYEDIRNASEQAMVWSPVRKAILYFLETGKQNRENSSEWPLPDTGIETSNRSQAEKVPNTHVLIEIAILENRTDDVLKWFDIHKQKRNNHPDDALNNSVAMAIAHKYPDLAIKILKELGERHISVTNVSSYSIGARYLQKAQRILQQNGREAEWNEYLQGLKNANRRKPRCIQILDSLSEKPIIRGP